VVNFELKKYRLELPFDMVEEETFALPRTGEDRVFPEGR